MFTRCPHRSRVSAGPEEHIRAQVACSEKKRDAEVETALLEEQATEIDRLLRMARESPADFTADTVSSIADKVD